MNNQQIGKEIKRQYAAGQYAVLGNGQWEFAIDRLTLRCQGGREHVLAVAHKYEKGLPHSGCTGPLKVSPGNRRIPQSFSKAALESFLQDGETENGEQYVRAHLVFQDQKVLS